MRQITEVINNSTSCERRHTSGKRTAAALALAAGALMLGGCNADSFFDPSVLGRWENTPTTMPILDRIAAIEDKEPDFVETVPPAREDLIAEAQPYRLGPSDDIEVRIKDFESVGFTSPYPRQIDQRGYVNLPRIGQVYLLGLTDIEAQEAIANVIRSAEILAAPDVSVQVLAARQLTFSMLGGVRQAGTFIVTKPDYRLLDAMAAAGGFDETVDVVYIVRQIPLSEAARGRTAPPPALPPATRDVTAPPVDPDSLLEEIERLTKPPSNPPAGGEGGGLSVVSRGGGVSGAEGERRALRYTGMQPEQPEAPKTTPPIDLIDSTAPEGARSPSGAEVQPGEGAASTPVPSGRARTRWVFLNGQWTRDASPAPQAGAAPGSDPLEGTTPGAGVMTQRVIKVPVRPLLAGQADVNVIIRPGDVIRVPVPASGVIYIGGQVARPGTFTLPPTGKLTLLRCIVAAGGLGQLGIPERVDLTRMVGNDREATIRLNMRAIAERTQPDVVLKADDHINVGTNFWAYPIAIIRNGFRMSYGFGFLIDRNFGNDVFGPPPESSAFGN